MKYSWIRPLLGIVLFSSSPAFAGGAIIIGGGGNAAICERSSGRTHTELFDYAEAERMGEGFVLDLGPDNLTPEQKIYGIVLKRLERFSPERAWRYGAEIATILKGNTFTDDELTPINDSANFITPAGCRLEQLAIRVNPAVDPYGRRLVISQKLWDQLDNNSKAGLLLHEAIYGELIALGATNSVGARYFNAWISSSQMNGATLPQFVNVLQKAGMQDFEYEGFKIDITQDSLLSFYRSGRLASGALVAGSAVAVIGEATNVPTDGLASFYESGKVKTFYPRGPINIQGWPVYFAELTLDENGNPSTGCIYRDAMFRTEFDDNIDVPAVSTVILDAHGYLLSSSPSCASVSSQF